jgi:hypothetical protein
MNQAISLHALDLSFSNYIAIAVPVLTFLSVKKRKEIDNESLLSFPVYPS